MSEIVLSIVSARHISMSDRRRGYPATHAMMGHSAGAICGCSLQGYSINGDSRHVNCKRCLKMLAKMDVRNPATYWDEREDGTP